MHASKQSSSSDTLRNERAPAVPPNGGRTAWLQVLGCHFLFFNSWGIVNAFGAYQDFYSTHYLTSNSASAVSWIGTIQGFLMICVGVITGPLYDMGYLHYLIYIGTFLNVFGLMMTSLSTAYYQVFLSFGVCVGLGSACLFVPSVAIVATWFTTKRSAATGLAAAGGSLGGLIYPIVFRKLEITIGYGWATRVIGFISFGTLLVSAMVLKPRILPPKKRALLDRTAFKDMPFILFSLSLFFIFIGLYIPFFYMPSYATEKIHTSQSLGFYLLAILNAASIFGRIIPNIIADKYGSLNILAPFILVAGGLQFAWIGIHNLAGIIVFCILFGFFSGSIVSLPPTALVTLSPDLSVIGTRMGMCFSFAGLGLLIGNPIAGAILTGKSGFMGLKAFGGATVIVGFVCMAMAWLVHKRGIARGTAVIEK
ncbi:major facilitator superfamily protein-5 [Coleophoma crateriformis]|uniref:Major facilitator superfamily protein-5 n=1 Tax=Coleophoma crateriformis TaxID=565419 RepID=A0A3D8R8L1_9HELO|nr:major facilitator superfamily protein-5 [Coleophoma crateriformis]